MKPITPARVVAALLLLAAYSTSYAQACFRTSVMAPTPLMGNHGEIFRTLEGAIFEVVGSYEYLYAYYPDVTICPDRGRMLVEGTTVGIRALTRPEPQANQQEPRRGAQPSAPSRPRSSRSSDAPIQVVFRISGCDYFIADGPNGLYVLEWYGGYDPDKGDGIYGEIRSYGFKNIIYSNGREGRIYVDDYALSRDSALERLQEQCQ